MAQGLRESGWSLDQTRKERFQSNRRLSINSPDLLALFNEEKTPGSRKDTGIKLKPPTVVETRSYVRGSRETDLEAKGANAPDHADLQNPWVPRGVKAREVKDPKIVSTFLLDSVFDAIFQLRFVRAALGASDLHQGDVATTRCFAEEKAIVDYQPEYGDPDTFYGTAAKLSKRLAQQPLAHTMHRRWLL